MAQDNKLLLSVYNTLVDLIDKCDGSEDADMARVGDKLQKIADHLDQVEECRGGGDEGDEDEDEDEDEEGEED